MKIDNFTDVALGYTLASGKFFAPDFGTFQVFCEKILGRPIMTHEFADPKVLEEIRSRFEEEAKIRFSQ